MPSTLDDPRIAVVGMAGRFPGARNVEELWRNLRRGKESVRFLSVEELLERGLDPALLDDPAQVSAVAEMSDPDAFDAPFFGFSHREAEILDPQQRVLSPDGHCRAFDDGALKVGYTAPSVEGQAGFCAIGSLKTNVGHLDAAAGVAGLIKTVLALEHREISPSLHFEVPNPKIDFAASPVYVARELAEWKNTAAPRRRERVRHRRHQRFSGSPAAFRRRPGVGT